MVIAHAARYNLVPIGEFAEDERAGFDVTTFGHGLEMLSRAVPPAPEERCSVYFEATPSRSPVMLLPAAGTCVDITGLAKRRFAFCRRPAARASSAVLFCYESGSDNR